MNSDITKYGLIGLSVERRFASQRWSHACFRSAMRGRAPVSCDLPPQPVLYRLDELRQHQLGVAEDRDRGVVGFVEVARIVGRVDDFLPGRDDRGRDVVSREARADREDHVGIEQELASVPGIDDAARAQRQRMVLGKGALAVGRRHDRDVEQFGERDQLVAGFGVQHALAGDDDRRLRLDQHFRGVVDVARVAGRAGRADRRVIDIVAGELGDVMTSAGTSTMTGPGRPFFSALKARRIAGTVCSGSQHRLDMLGHALVGAGRVEQRPHRRGLARMAERDQQDRGRVGIGRGDAGKGVLGAGPVLHREDAGRLAVGDAGAAVGHVDADPLLAADHRPHAARHRRLDDRRRRETEHRRDPFALQDLGDRVHDQHRRFPLWVRLCGGSEEPNAGTPPAPEAGMRGAPAA